MEVHTAIASSSMTAPFLRSRTPEPQTDSNPSAADSTQPEKGPSVVGTSPADSESETDKRMEGEEKRKQQEVQTEIKALAARDREVRAHEQAHVAAGGQYAGAATYEFKRGPDGVNYAVGGEVKISTSKENTPEATLRKAQIIRRAALAPAEPSPQDRRVAAMATRMEAQARAEIAQQISMQQQKGQETTESEEQSAAGGQDESGRSIPESSSTAEVKPRSTSLQLSSLNQYLSVVHSSSDNVARILDTRI